MNRLITMIFRQFSSVTEDTQLNYIYILNSINRRDEKEKTRGTIAKIDPEQYRTTTAATRIAVILVAHLMRVTHGCYVIEKIIATFHLRLQYLSHLLLTLISYRTRLPAKCIPIRCKSQ